MGNNFNSVDVAVIESEEEFGLLGRDVNRVELQNGQFRLWPLIMRLITKKVLRFLMSTPWAD